MAKQNMPNFNPKRASIYSTNPAEATYARQGWLPSFGKIASYNDNTRIGTIADGLDVNGGPNGRKIWFNFAHQYELSSSDCKVGTEVEYRIVFEAGNGFYWKGQVLKKFSREDDEMSMGMGSYAPVSMEGGEFQEPIIPSGEAASIEDGAET